VLLGERRCVLGPAAQSLSPEHQPLKLCQEAQYGSAQRRLAVIFVTSVCTRLGHPLLLQTWRTMLHACVLHGMVAVLQATRGPSSFACL
jgi:hypothetical protein